MCIIPIYKGFWNQVNVSYLAEFSLVFNNSHNLTSRLSEKHIELLDFTLKCFENKIELAHLNEFTYQNICFTKIYLMNIIFDYIVNIIISTTVYFLTVFI